LGRHAARRRALPFRAVNRPGSPGFDRELQRHHLLPCQLLAQNCFAGMFDLLGRERVGFDDFRLNGLLLPCSEPGALRIGLPLHRGPHPAYNRLVIERVGSIEAQLATCLQASPREAIWCALFRLALLQAALRRRLLDEQRRFILNRKDPLGAGFDFAELDAMAETLWKAT
jgi:hypothetical protein